MDGARNSLFSPGGLFYPGYFGFLAVSAGRATPHGSYFSLGCGIAIKASSPTAIIKVFIACLPAIPIPNLPCGPDQGKSRIGPAGKIAIRGDPASF